MAIKKAIKVETKEANSLNVLGEKKVIKTKKPNMEYIKERYRILTAKDQYLLSEEEFAELTDIRPLIQKSIKGRTSKQKGGEFERQVARSFGNTFDIELVRTPQSGGFVKNSDKADDFRGDIVPVERNIKLQLHLECKNQKTWKIPEWYRQAKEDCPKGKIPLVVFHKHNSNENFVHLSLEDFLSIIDKSKIIKEVL